MDRAADLRAAQDLAAEHLRLLAKLTIHGTQLSVQVERLERAVVRIEHALGGLPDDTGRPDPDGA